MTHEKQYQTSGFMKALGRRHARELAERQGESTGESHSQERRDKIEPIMDEHGKVKAYRINS